MVKDTTQNHIDPNKLQNLFENTVSSAGLVREYLNSSVRERGQETDVKGFVAFSSFKSVA
jgi:hypothetical protein